MADLGSILNLARPRARRRSAPRHPCSSGPGFGRRGRHPAVLFALGLAAAVSLGACSGGGAAGDCTDGIDNDGDGVIDTEDPGCALNAGVAEFPDPERPACDNGEDDDADGVVDFPTDPGCRDAEDNNETDPGPPPPECNDAIDNNGNGVMDYPADPGCTDLMDETEDPSPVETECSDGADNDGDGTADYPADSGCSAASDDDEYSSADGDCGPGIDVQPFPGTGSAELDVAGGGANELVGLCGGLGQEFVWTYTVTGTTPVSLVVQTNHPETTLDTVIYVRSTCRSSMTELACDDDDPPSHAGTLVIPEIQPGTYFLVVDSFGASSTGHVKVTAETRIAKGQACDPATPDVCAPGLVCRKLTSTATTTTCELLECLDGLDNDGDGATDFPADSGCGDASDNSELIPSGQPIPACGNGTDDDADGLVDYPADPGCAAASDDVELDECAPGVEVLPLPASGTTGTTVGGSMQFTASCDSSSSLSPERVHAYKVTAPLAKLRFSTAGTSFDNVLYVRSGTCSSGPEVGCSSQTSTNTQTVEIASPPLGETYFVFVDGDYDTSGNYFLSVSGEIAGGAACTPGSTEFVCTAGYACSAATSTCVPVACNDGADNDGDGKADYPLDPGCSGIADDSEADPTTPPVCANGVDDDGDGLIDYPGDGGCAAASDGSEIDECVPGVEVFDLGYDGATGQTVAGTPSAFQGTCASPSQNAPEHVYVFTVKDPIRTLTFTSNGTTFDSVLYVRTGDCATGTQVGCDDDIGDGGEIINLNNPAAGDYFVFIDGYGSSQTGAYTLTVEGTMGAGGPCGGAAPGFTCEVGTVCDAATSLCAKAACDDGLDNDGDGKVDAFDPGCTTAGDTDETDPATAPACADGVDNDGDAAIDYPADPGCGRAADGVETDCADTDPLVDVTTMQTYSGATTGMTHDYTPSCRPTSTAKDVVHTFTVPGAMKSLTFDVLGASYDTVLFVRIGGCDESDLACNDDTGSNPDSTVSLVDVPAGTYFVVVDGYGSSSAGTYPLHTTGVIKAGEPCNPAQVVPGFLACESGACVDNGSGFRCQ